MLVLTIHNNGGPVIVAEGTEYETKVYFIKGDNTQVRLGFEAPRSVQIVRSKAKVK